MRTKKEIIETRDDAQKGVDECEEHDSLIYQGWVEALDYILTGYQNKKGK